jgi:hypothetical protein
LSHQQMFSTLPKATRFYPPLVAFTFFKKILRKALTELDSRYIINER